MPDASKPKIMVAVHGVGDQLSNETVRSVAAQVCRYYGREGMVSLGAFPGPASASGFIMELPQGVPPYVGFAEVYWADIARRVASGGYVLEDAREWAKTIVARVQASAASAAGTEMSENDYLLVENVLEELIDTVKVVDRLCFIASKAGLFTVNLQRILDHFVNDVQLVADFQPYRDEILGAFHKLMGTVFRRHPDAEIYVVAHSEGTVVALAGLLSAIGNPDGVAVAADGIKPAVRHRDWLDRVRGVMTIGAPLDTHMLLWRPLWRPLIPPEDARWTTKTPIPWHNYFDRGDPIADSLKTTKGWLNEHCSGAFDIKVDQGFSRFLFPGKAHIDYWHDDHVFGHFIEKVTGLPAEPLPRAAAAAGQPPMPPVVPAVKPSPKKQRKRPDYSQPPKSKRWPQFVSYFAPYGLIALLSYAAVFILYKVVTDYLRNKPGSAIWRDVFTLAFLMVGMTIAVRIPRLSAMWRWRLFGLGLFALAAVGYGWPIRAFEKGHPLRGMQDKIAVEVFGRFGVPDPFDVWALLIGAGAVVLGCWALGRSKHNRAGIKILLGFGGVLVLVIVVGLIHKVMVESKAVESKAAVEAKKPAVESSAAVQKPTAERASVAPPPQERALWPVFVAAAAFFYLWWLTALLFDLVFVWHRYIRHSAALADLRELQSTSKGEGVKASTA